MTQRRVDGLVGLAQNFQVDGVEGQLGQDAGQNRRDPHKGVEQAGDQAAQQACHQSQQQGHPDIAARQQSHDADRAAGTERAVHRQVGHIQNAIGDVHADGHNTPDQALRAGSRQSAGQICQSR